MTWFTPYFYMMIYLGFSFVKSESLKVFYHGRTQQIAESSAEKLTKESPVNANHPPRLEYLEYLNLPYLSFVKVLAD